jgi:hypothetical protein
VPRLCALVLLLILVTASRGQTSPADADTFFELRIRPILADTCFKCHGGKKVSHGLRVDSREALLKGGDSGPAIIPGDPQKSLLIQAIRYAHADLKMPPDKRLPDSVAADFTAWVQRGAPWPRAPSPTFRTQKHWAFEPVRPISPPPDANAWSDNPIDRFIACGLRANGLHPVGSADRRTLLRRVTFDLVGLPPTPQEMADFLADQSSGALARVVDRLLASPHYGERWARHWMDVARYADTAGDNADYPVPEVRLYRDYLIDSFNADKPYDQLVREQIAGDILARAGPHERHAEQIIATGFLALSRRYATGPYELWHLTLEDAIETTGRAFLGLTLRCARCHDHKFDPVTKEDYYALYGIFASTQFPWAGGEEFSSMKKPREHFVPLAPTDEATRSLAAYRQKIRQLEDDLRRTEQDSDLARRLRELEQQIAAKGKTKQDSLALQKERDQVRAGLQGMVNHLQEQHRNLIRSNLPPEIPGAYAVQEGRPVDAYVQIRGDVDQHGPIVKRNVPRFLAGKQPPVIPPGSSGRLELARWLTRPDHPLTARVMVNRVWQQHFGKGIVATPSNFGLRGEPPTHPELLDWLAARFVANGWSIKALHRDILLSKTYQLASSYDDGNAARDPGNRWHWRSDRRRLDAEAIRDALLTLGGNLDESRPGPHPFPPIDRWGWTQHNPFKDVYPSRHRSVYLMTQRFQRHPYLALFDGADTNMSTEQRRTSTVPQQALFLMNNPFVQEQAEGFARRLLAAAGDARQRIELAHQWAWSRPALSVEEEAGASYVSRLAEELKTHGGPPDRIEQEAWTSYAKVLLCANEFVYLD